MLNKIFLGLLAASIIGILSLTYLSYWWLNSITNPADVVANYNFYSNIYWSFLWISSLILLIAGNIILWKTRRSWAIWTAFGYFTIFILLKTWWLGEMYHNYLKQNSSGDNGFSFGGIFAVLLCVIVAVGVFFNQFLVLRMRDRVHGNPNAENIIIDDKELESDEKNR